MNLLGNLKRSSDIRLDPLSRGNLVNVYESKMFTLALINEPTSQQEGWREEEDLTFKPEKRKMLHEKHYKV